LLSCVINVLETNGHTVNPLNANRQFRKGYWLTPTRLKPWKRRSLPYWL
jgi:hypothetical protein